jgi:hypothetical protein
MQNYKPFAKFSNRDLRVLGCRRLPSAVCRLNPSKILEKFLGGAWGFRSPCVWQGWFHNLFVINLRNLRSSSFQFTPFGKKPKTSVCLHPLSARASRSSTNPNPQKRRERKKTMKKQTIAQFCVVAIAVLFFTACSDDSSSNPASTNSGTTDPGTTSTEVCCSGYDGFLGNKCADRTCRLDETLAELDALGLTVAEFRSQCNASGGRFYNSNCNGK